MKKQLTVQIGIYALSILLTALLWSRPVVLAICLALVSALILLKWNTKSDLAFYFAAFVLGPVGEGFAVHFGAWHYSNPLWLIPVWLPLLWGIAALFLKKTAELLVNTDRTHQTEDSYR
jgi:uncharacterized membrane protein YoaT (DUF817 family)